MVIRSALRLTLAVLLCAAASSAWATGNYIPEMRFFSRSGTDGAGDLAFFHSHLGILRPTLDDNRLFAAYRQMMGGSFTDAQAKALLAPCCDAGGRNDGDSSVWDTARKRVLNQARSIPENGSRDRPPELAALDVSCFPNAYRNAATTLNERIKEHGASDPSVREWTTGQDAVLANCFLNAGLPPELPNAPDWLKADRAYQIASAYLYRLDYGRAAELYAEIGRDTASPWRKVARYLTARAAVHAANAERTPERIAAAKSAIAAIASDAELADYRDDAQKLASLLAFGAEPQQRAQELAQSLLAADLPPTLAADLHDFRDLERSGQRYTEAGAWIYDINSLSSDKSRADAKADVLRRWHDTHALPWLVAAMMYLDAKDADAAEAMTAAQAIDAGSPAYYTLAWNRLRLLIAQGKASEARAELDRIIASPALPEGVGNLMRYQRLKLARDVGEFATYAVRRGEFLMYVYDQRTGLGATPLPLSAAKRDHDTEAEIGWRGELTQKDVPAIDADAAYAMSTFMPLPLMAKVVLAPGLPANVRRDLALTVWTRAVLLADAETGRAMAEALSPFFPQYADGFRSYLSAGDASARKIEAALLLLKLPAANPYPDFGLGYTYKREVIGLFGPRWWTANDKPYAPNLDDNDKASLCTDCGLPLPLVAPAFTTDAERARAKADNERLAKLASAPTWLGGIVIPWAKAHLSDPRVPEALHNVVRATQYGDMDSDTSKAAYELLHGKFPHNPWTAKTPHRF
jgi:hypothetical protein